MLQVGMTRLTFLGLAVFLALMDAGCHQDRWIALEATAALQGHCPIERVHVLSFDSHGRYTVQVCGHTRIYIHGIYGWQRARYE